MSSPSTFTIIIITIFNVIVTFDNRLVLNKHDDDNDDDDDDDDDDYDDYDDKLVSVFQITSGKIFRFAVE